MQGNQSAWADIGTIAMKHLGASKVPYLELLIERENTISKLRELCAEFGDNDWEKDLYMPDIIEKHLAKHLYNQQ